MLKEIRKNYKRLVAFLLSITMIIMNMGGNAITAFAGEEREISLFMAEGEKILEAAAHLQDQEEFTKEDLEEMGLDAPKNSIIKKYEKLFLPEEGKIYELDVAIDDHLAAEGTELRIFYHSKEKEVIFLFLNESNQDIDFCVNIDGYETKLVTVASNTAAVEAGEEETAGDVHHPVRLFRQKRQWYCVRRKFRRDIRKCIWRSIWRRHEGNIRQCVWRNIG